MQRGSLFEVFNKNNDMKIYFAFVCMLCFSAFNPVLGQDKVIAQDSAKVVVTPPVIAVKLMLGKKVVLSNTEITFEAVLEDSRCPKNVTCIWAGQATIKVRVKPQGSPTDLREITFSPGLQGPILLAVTKDCRIVVDNVHPYPIESTDEAAKKGYFISLRELPLEKE
tara:strand:- start:1278 stop:1778 length:501 start_codon:yes stop_codon:yes gene_type:complete